MNWAFVIVVAVALVSVRTDAAGNAVGYVGCYRDGSPRDLEHRIPGGNQTPDRCQASCVSAGFPFSSVQYGGADCWCSHTFGRHGKLADSACDMVCSAQTQYFCGGLWKNSVYKTSWNRVDQKGCYVDTADHDLPHQIPGTTHDASTCKAACLTAKYAYAGLQNGGECWCGSTFGKHGVAPVEECNKPCQSMREMCGGQARNNILITGAAPVASNYIGCYMDDPVRDFVHQVVGHGKTPENCKAACGALNYLYSAVQYTGNDCWCGNSYGRHGKVPESDCNTACATATQYVCGGHWRNSVYRTSVSHSADYVGCYVDTSVHDLAHSVPGTSFTWSTCKSACAAAQFKYAALQNFGYCYCGNTFGSYGEASVPHECNEPCKRPADEMCGGSLRNSVLKSGYAPPTNAGNYIGCYKDESTRDLSHMIPGGGHTPDGCKASCAAKNYLYSAVQDGGSICFCGNSYNHYGTAPETECGSACTASPTYNCGGVWRNSVYRTSVALPTGIKGCYVDDGANRDLPVTVPGSTFNWETCKEQCRDRKHKYAAVQFGGECFCGDSYGKHGATTALKSCGMPCKRPAEEMCGANLESLVLETNYRPVAPGYVGCFKDAHTRDMPHQIHGMGHAYTIEACRKGCGDLNYMFAGLQYKGDCWCSNAFNHYGRMPETDCGTVCTADPGFYCGGGWRNSVYRTAHSPPDYMGCFDDNMVEKAVIAVKTRKACQDGCAKAKFMFAAMVNGGEACYCGNAYGSAGAKSSVMSCDVPCGDDTTMICGGTQYNSVTLTSHKPPGFLGCFLDKATHDLPTRISGATGTIVQCKTACMGRAMQYAAMQNGNECYCGNAYGKYGALSMSRCNKRCAGDSSVTCGGENANQVFEVSSRDKAYVGCFVDVGERRDLWIEKHGNKKHTPATCIEACKQAGHRFAAVQNGGADCWCGMEYGLYGSAGAVCDKACTADPTQMCGGYLANDVYMTGLNMATPKGRVGCYKSGTNPLTELSTQQSSQVLYTPVTCSISCGRAGFKYAALRESTKCFCGNTYGAAGTAGALCNLPCTADPSYVCGGATSWDVYQATSDTPSVPVGALTMPMPLEHTWHVDTNGDFHLV